MSDQEKISVPISQDLIAELYARAGKGVCVVGVIENVFSDFLERTRDDDTMWQDSWVQQRYQDDEDQIRNNDFGPASGGYRWGAVFLRNGTKIRMEYRGRLHYAAVKHDAIEFDGLQLSPSRLATKIAAGTARNAWRDLWIQEPGSSTWVLADDLRRKAPR